MILVEGLDNTGKTTLVDSIQEHFPALRHRSSIGNQHPPDNELLQMAWDEVNPNNWDVVSDRSRIVSEFCYGSFTRPTGPRWAVDVETELMSRLLHHPHLIVWCNRPLERIIETFDEREQLGGVFEHLVEIQTAYERIIKFLDYMGWIREREGFPSLRTVQYDFEQPVAVDVVMDAVKAYLEVAKQ